MPKHRGPFSGLLKGALCLLTVFSLAATGWAQHSRISGTVTDSSGGVIPGVAVNVTHLDTGVSRQTVTDDSGRYTVPQLFSGDYRVSASLAGFGTQKLLLLLDPRQTTEQSFQLSVGAPSNVVEVASSGARINMKPYEMATVIDPKQIEQLPLDGRNILALAGLSPGIIKGSQAGRGELAEEGFKSGGLAMEHVAISLDGVDNTGRVVYGPLSTQSMAAKPPPEAIAEFKVITNNTSAEYGTKAGATILITTRGGTNRFRGSLYEFHRNAAVAANNFMFNRDGPRDPDTDELTSEPPPYIRNQFGGTLGGPIMRDKTFFFFSFQGTRLVSSGNSFLQEVPSPLARVGDFSREDCSRDGRCPDIYDPLSLIGTEDEAERTVQFPDNVIPQNRVDPAAIQVLNLYPTPNREGEEFEQSNYFYIQKNTNDSELYDVRIDHNFSENHRMFGRFSHRNNDKIQGGQFPFPARSGSFSEFRTKQFSVNYSAGLGSHVHNEFRSGFSLFPASRIDEHTENLNARFGIPNAAPEQHPELAQDPRHHTGLVSFNFQGRYDLLGGGAGGGTISGRLDTYTIADNLLWDVGKHSLKLGVEYRRWDNLRSQLPGNNLGTMVFDGRFTARFPNEGQGEGSRRETGHAIADAMLGWTWWTVSNLPVGEDIKVPSWSFFAQDDWRITPRLTLNLGLRYELFLQPRVDTGSGLQNARAVWSGKVDEVSTILPVRFEVWEFPRDDNDCGCRLDYSNFAPRIGIAYRITNHTVIRAGGGLYYSENGTAGIMSNRFNAGGPVVLNSTVNTGSREDPVTTVSEGFPLYEINEADPNLFEFTTLGSGGASNVPFYKDTMSVGQWFLDIQHQLPWDILMTVGYNGNSAGHLPWWNRNWGSPLEPGVLRPSQPGPEADSVPGGGEYRKSASQLADDWRTGSQLQLQRLHLQDRKAIQ